MTNTNDKLLLIDGNSIAYRAFFALYQSVDRFTNQAGLHTNALYGFNNMLNVILDTEKPTHVLVAFDAGKTTFRTKKYDNYKAGRSKTPPELKEQMPYFRELLAGYGIKTYELIDFEADDIIGTMAKKGEEAGYNVTIVTGDRDLTQLTTGKVTVSVTKKGVSEIEKFTPEHVMEKFGLTPLQIIDMKGLVGDTSDNYPGVTKVGEKTAIKLLTEYDSMENLYENIDQLKKSKMKEHLIEDKDQAFMSKDLARIRQDAPITIDFTDTKWDGQDLDKLVAFYEKMDFKKFLSQLNLNPASNSVEMNLFPEPKKTDYKVLTSDNLDELSKLAQPISFYLEMLEDNYHTADFDGFAIGDGKQFFVTRDVDLLKSKTLVSILSNDNIKKNVFNFKRNYVALNRLNIQLAGTEFDLLLASYLLDTSDNSNDLSKVAQKHDYYDVKSDEEVYGKGVKRAIPEDDIFFSHMASKVDAINLLKEPLMAGLVDHEQMDLYTDMELPLSLVLAKMEIQGINVDADRLKIMQKEFSTILSDMETKIYSEAGEEFNINSPKQLGVILFEKLKLPVVKKTKTGYSTAVDVLEQLRTIAPIADLILKYRQIAKIQSTYVEGLLKVRHEDKKVHTRYLQTLTATGRLSSVDPNLQNIPVRVPEGKKIRQAFIPEHKGWKIFSSDYSQIELRVLAHIAHDANMQEAFKEGIDIHANTAMKIFSLESPDDVTSNMRRTAKAVNFGIVYGISDYGLSQNIGITRKQAQTFIDTYLNEFTGVKNYMESVVREAKDKGYVETLFHRRRYLPDINSRNFNLRSFAERTAMNTPIQGSAADIIKVAMINMNKMLEEEHLQAKMLLQVHDELIFEAPEEEIAILQKKVPEVMDAAVSLEVPLKVESAFGDSWFDTK
ncbi:DNA polymerase I [Dellaglioa sp. P0083]|uniref:DNA polymerase I n=1 Tax=Dellaglioa kimchii TaxID=3344667 RepID=UPI0038D35837